MNPAAKPKFITISQAVNYGVLTLMVVFVVFVRWATARHIAIPPEAVALAGLTSTAIAGICRSYVAKFAGLITPPATAAGAPSAPSDPLTVVLGLLSALTAHTAQTTALVDKTLTDKTQSMNQTALLADLAAKADMGNAGAATDAKIPPAPVSGAESASGGASDKQSVEMLTGGPAREGAGYVTPGLTTSPPDVIALPQPPKDIGGMP